MIVPVKIKLDHPLARLPEYKHPGDSGMDVCVIEEKIIHPGHTLKIDTGLKVEIPDGYEIQCRSRSGLALKGIVVTNSPGTIDSNFRGRAAAIITNHSNTPFIVHVGDRLMQWVLCEVPKCKWIISDELSDSERGTSGYGSTGVSA